jgi:hypothetical protein
MVGDYRGFSGGDKGSQSGTSFPGGGTSLEDVVIYTHLPPSYSRPAEFLHIHTGIADGYIVKLLPTFDRTVVKKTG